MSKNTDGAKKGIVEENATRVRAARWTRTDAVVYMTPDDSMTKEEVVNPPSGPSLKDVFDAMEMPPPSCNIATCLIVREWIQSWLDGSDSIETRLFATCSNGCGLVFCGECLDLHESFCDVPETPRSWASPRRVLPEVKKPRVDLEEGSTSESRCACNIASA